MPKLYSKNKILDSLIESNVRTKIDLMVTDKLIRSEINRYVTNMLTENRSRNISDTDVSLLRENVKSYAPTLNKDVLGIRKRVRNNPYCKNEMIVEGRKIALDDSTMKRLTKSDFDSLETLTAKLRTIIEE